MTEKTQNRSHGIGMFALKTVCYALILLGLLYLYQYSGLSSVHFIYNEF
ncbi:MAG: teichoic acid D-Ala incorporation-associated protein DltX [Lactobacillus sp.]|nr:teichoic acid D-Ala incorporation-associated protein DltX [Lactobacillus sp.]